jgi:flagellar assembly factor FliW
MKIQSERFGTFEVEDSDAIRFPEGVVGFPEEREFVLLRHREASPIGWLQSVSNGALAFPVVSVDALALAQPYPNTNEPANPHAVMAVLSAAAGKPATVNLLAPIVVNVTTRIGTQVLLDDAKFSTTEPFALRQSPRHPPAGAIAAHATNP